ncbi:hypothetical protein LJR034_005230 [Caballeronia sp. LjRoot34]|uniref:hypothetical protein n=1 Tax=Caballeronia sp. LjRoot34 TaxID=3342325 RepID=UPI003ED02B26
MYLNQIRYGVLAALLFLMAVTSSAIYADAFAQASGQPVAASSKAERAIDHRFARLERRALTHHPDVEVDDVRIVAKHGVVTLREASQKASRSQKSATSCAVCEV